MMTFDVEHANGEADGTVTFYTIADLMDYVNNVGWPVIINHALGSENPSIVIYDGYIE